MVRPSLYVARAPFEKIRYDRARGTYDILFSRARANRQLTAKSVCGESSIWKHSLRPVSKITNSLATYVLYVLILK